MLSNKKDNTKVTEFFITDRKLNISIIFITQSYFSVPKNAKLNSAHYFIMKIPNKRGLIIHQILNLKTLLKNVLKNHIIIFNC